jgi:arabinogalactan oligomer / maltooligosaccharide transport system permease protein
MWLAKGLTLELAIDRLVELLPLLAITIIGTAILELVVYLVVGKLLRSKFTLPYTLVAPAAMALLLFTVYPFVYNIRLAFSDLRLKTMSCYISNADVTDAPCSLSKAAPGAEVEVQIDDLPAWQEPNRDTAEPAFTLDKGQTIQVTGRSSKIQPYITDPGQAVYLTDDGTTITGETCPNPLTDPEGSKECRAAYAEFKLKFIEMQDQRDWWPIKTDGQEGWLPDEMYYAAADAPLYADQTGDEVIGQVSERQELLQAAAGRPPTEWYQIALDDGTTGWARRSDPTGDALVSVSQSYFPASDVTLYDATDTASEVVGAATAGTETVLRTTTTVTWYQVQVEERLLPGEGQQDLRVEVGWINIAKTGTPSITVFNAGTDADIYADIQDIDATTGEQPADKTPSGAVAAGDKLILRAEDTSTDTTWYQIETATGETGWVATSVLNRADVQILNVDPTLPLYQEPNTDSEVIDTIGDIILPPAPAADDAGDGDGEPAPTLGDAVRVTYVDRDTDRDVSWYRISTPERVSGWTNQEPAEIRTNYLAAQDVTVYPDPGAVGEPLATIDKSERVPVTDPEPAEFQRYRVRLYDAENTVGWLDQKPETVVTTERDVVLYSLEYGWNNFKRVFVKEKNGEIQGWGRLLQTQNSTFPRLMRTTLAWTSLNVIFHLIGGMMLALVLNRPGLKLRGLYRAIIILPWAIPQPIIALAWKGEFHYNFGFVNTMLVEIGLDRINWLFSPGPAFAAVTFVNIWLGIPFYMVTLLGGLQSIAGEYYEAAEIDGANPWQRFRHITVPLIRPVAVPIITLDVIWTFNNFNVIYLITKGEPNESTNILVTALYNAAFGENGQFQLGFAAAFSLVIFAVLFIFAAAWVVSSGALKGVYEES